MFAHSRCHGAQYSGTEPGNYYVVKVFKLAVDAMQAQGYAGRLPGCV